MYFKILKYAMYYFVQLSVCLSQGEGVIVPLAPSPHATASPLPHMGGYFLMDSNLTILVCRQKKKSFMDSLELTFVKIFGWMNETVSVCMDGWMVYKLVNETINVCMDG